MTTALQEVERTDTTTSLYASPLDVLGTDVSQASSFREALTKAKLADWDVRLREIQTIPVPEETLLLPTGVSTIPARPSISIPNQFAVIRNSPTTGAEEAIGVVGKKYTVMQPEEIEDFMLALLDETGGQITRGGDYYGDGKQFWLTVDLPSSVLIGGRDLVDHNLTVFSSNDGSTSVRPVISNIRVMCQNMRNHTIRSGIETASIRHTASLSQRLQATKTALSITWKAAQAFDRKAEEMVQAPMSAKDFWTLVDVIWTPRTGATATDTSQRIEAARRASLAQRWNGAETANIKNTAWAGFNAVTSHLQHANANATLNARRALTSSNNELFTARAEKLFHDYALAAA